MKKTSIVILALIACIFFSGFALAYSQILLFVNGKQIDPPVPPQIIDGTTMVPIRTVAESLDCNVNWHDGIIEISSKGQAVNANIEMSGSEDFQAIVKRALDKMDTKTRDYVVKHVRKIKYEEIPISISPNSSLSMDWYYTVRVNGLEFNRLKKIIDTDEITYFYLASLVHEATHSYMFQSGMYEKFTLDDQEVICNLAAFRALEDSGVPKSCQTYSIYKKAVTDNLKLQ